MSDFKVKGVSFDELKQKWVARKYSNGKNYFLGQYDTREEAEAALHGFDGISYSTVRETTVRVSLYQQSYAVYLKKSVKNNQQMIAKYGVKPCPKTDPFETL